MSIDLNAVPNGYVLHTRKIACRACGTTSYRSEFYSLYYLKSRINGKPERHLVACKVPMFNVPCERIVLEPMTLPFCAECETIDVSALPTPPQAALLYDLDGPALRMGPSAVRTGPKSPTAKSPTTTKPTIGDLA
jgi:hypothetical protein